VERAQEVADRHADPATSLLTLLAHDLREPFGPLALALSMLAESVAAEDAELVQLAEVNCRRVVRLIDAVQWAMRPPSTVELERADLAEIAGAAAEIAGSIGTVCVVDASRCIVDVAPSIVRDAIAGLLECVPQGTTASVSVRPDGARAAFELRTDDVHLTDALACAAPRDRRSAFVLGAAAVFAAHAGELEVGSSAISGWLPLRA
jgi:hypothetical protein